MDERVNERVNAQMHERVNERVNERGENEHTSERDEDGRMDETNGGESEITRTQMKRSGETIRKRLARCDSCDVYPGTGSCLCDLARLPSEAQEIVSRVPSEAQEFVARLPSEAQEIVSRRSATPDG